MPLTFDFDSIERDPRFGGLFRAARDGRGALVHRGVLLACLVRGGSVTASTPAAVASVTTSRPATAPTSETTKGTRPCR